MKKGVTSSSGFANSSVPQKYIIHDGDVLFSWSGTLDVCLWCAGRGALNQHLFKVTSSDYPKWFYYFWLKERLPEFQAIASDKVTTMGHIQRHHLSEAFAAVPSDELLKKLDKIQAPLVEKLVQNNLETHILARLRDTLVPKLVSGEIRLRQAERIVAEAV